MKRKSKCTISLSLVTNFRDENLKVRECLKTTNMTITAGSPVTEGDRYSSALERDQFTQEAHSKGMIGASAYTSSPGQPSTTNTSIAIPSDVLNTCASCIRFTRSEQAQKQHITITRKFNKDIRKEPRKH